MEIGVTIIKLWQFCQGVFRQISYQAKQTEFPRLQHFVQAQTFGYGSDVIFSEFTSNFAYQVNIEHIMQDRKC